MAGYHEVAARLEAIGCKLTTDPLAVSQLVIASAESDEVVLCGVQAGARSPLGDCHLLVVRSALRDRHELAMCVAKSVWAKACATFSIGLIGTAKQTKFFGAVDGREFACMMNEVCLWIDTDEARRELDGQRAARRGRSPAIGLRRIPE